MSILRETLSDILSSYATKLVLGAAILGSGVFYLLSLAAIQVGN